MATSSPSLITLALGLLQESEISGCSSMSTYSRLIVTAELDSTLLVIPLYFSSSRVKRLDSGIGAGKSSILFLVKLAAEAK